MGPRTRGRKWGSTGPGFRPEKSADGKEFRPEKSSDGKSSNRKKVPTGKKFRRKKFRPENVPTEKSSDQGEREKGKVPSIGQGRYIAILIK